MQTKYKTAKLACYMTNISMSAVANLSPLLFLTFRNFYGISYSLLGMLVLINFCTQLAIDLTFSFFSHKFNITKTIKLMPILTVLGLLIYAAVPLIFPSAAYTGLIIGTLIFSASAGLAEVLISPVIAAIPAENPESEMSKLHSVYAWGVVGVVIISTLFLLVFGDKNWQWLALLWMLVPLASFFLFLKSELPQLKTPEKASNVWTLIKEKGFIICFFCIFFGGASECTMSQWSSSYLEQALNIPKLWGDIFGVAMFAVMLGLGRTLYSKFGSNIYIVLIAGAAGAFICYVTAALSNTAAVGLAACALTGLCTSMLWPGSLIAASDKFPSSGVAIFALMAAGGDLGASIAPQFVGIVTDFAVKNEYISGLTNSLALTAEQLGMKIGLVSASVFPIFALILFISVYKQAKRK